MQQLVQQSADYRNRLLAAARLELDIQRERQQPLSGVVPLQEPVEARATAEEHPMLGQRRWYKLAAAATVWRHMWTLRRHGRQ
jgi:hypothetical protein